MSDHLDAIKKLITATLGTGACKYAMKKQSGGTSGKKGSRYEDIFLGYKAAEIAVEYFGKPSPWPLLRGQVLGFVDDVVVNSSSETEYFQLKNVAAIRWVGGIHPIETDFQYQFLLASKLSEPNPKTILVVPSTELATELKSSVPDSIKTHTHVRFFPYADGSLNRILLDHPELQDVLKPLSKSAQPCLDELEGVWGVLVMSSFHHPEGGPVDELIRSANKKTPNQLRALAVVNMEQVIRREFLDALATIPGLTYAFDKGFFSWSGFGTSGTFPEDYGTQTFLDFQDEVVRQKPRTFDDFEGLLP